MRQPNLKMCRRTRQIIAFKQSHYTFERLGIAMCFHTALVSAVRTLRGEREQADNLREEAYTMMTKIVGPPER